MIVCTGSIHVHVWCHQYGKSECFIYCLCCLLAVLQPTNPHVILGVSINLTCTLYSNSPYDASHMYFSFTNTTGHKVLLSEENIYMVDNKRVYYSLVNATFEDIGTYDCRIPGLDADPMSYVDSQMLTVDCKSTYYTMIFTAKPL